jgi:hypothetical protein
LDYPAAVDELAWRFGCAEAAIGFRAQNMADIKGGTVFDEAASTALHLSKRTERHRWAVQRIVRIDACLRTLTPEQVSALRLAFTPHGGVSWQLTSAMSLRAGVHQVCVLGWVLRSTAFRTTYNAAHKSIVPPERHRAMAWLERLETAQGRRIRDAALDELAGPLGAYDAERQRRTEEEAQERRERKAEREALLEADLARFRSRVTADFERRLRLA